DPQSSALSVFVGSVDRSRRLAKKVILLNAERGGVCVGHDVASSSTGSVNRKTAPWGWFGVAPSRPPWASTMERLEHFHLGYIVNSAVAKPRLGVVGSDGGE